MNKASFTTVLLLVASLGYLHAQVKIDIKKLNPEAIKLNNQAFDLCFYNYEFDPKKRADTLKKAIKMLNRAIAIDSNYYIAYRNKMQFQGELKQQDSTLNTGKQIFNKWPEDFPNTITLGEYYEFKGDTTSAILYYKNALSVINHALDSITINNKHYHVDQIQKAKVLMLLNQPEKAHAILKHLLDKTTNPDDRQLLTDLMGMDRHAVLNGKTITDGNDSRTIDW